MLCVKLGHAIMAVTVVRGQLAACKHAEQAQVRTWAANGLSAATSAHLIHSLVSGLKYTRKFLVHLRQHITQRPALSAR